MTQRHVTRVVSLALTLVVVLMPLSCARAERPWPQDCFDDYAKPLVYKPADFLSGALLSLSGDVIARARQYHHNHIRQIEYNGEQWLNWKFNAKTSGQSPSMNFIYKITQKHAPVPGDPSIFPFRYAVTAKNAGAVPVRIRDGKSADHTLDAGQEQVLVFDSDQLCLIVAEIEKDTEYSLLLKDLELHYPAFEAAVRIAGTASIEPDKVFSAMIRTDPSSIKDARLFDLEVCDREWVLWRIRLDEKELDTLKRTGTCRIERPTPWYLPAGQFSVVAAIDHRRVRRQNAFAISIQNENTSLPTMTRKIHNGVPTFFMNGEPFIWSGFATYSFYPGSVNQFGYSNADVFFIPTAAGSHVHNISAPTWYGADQYDFGSIQQSVCQALAANPDAKLVFRVSLLLPPVWLAEHPDAAATIRTDDGMEVAWEETQSPAISLASQQWRQQQAKAFEELIAFCMHQPWSKNVVSFFPTGGVTEEWFAWGCNQYQFADYSPATEAAFAEWVKEKGFAFDRIPDPALRKDSSQIFFPDTRKGRWAAAYYAFYNQLNAETVEYFAKVAKEATGGKSLVGTLFGYVIQLTGDHRQSTAAQFSLGQLLESPHIDYLTGIPLLDFRQLTQDGYDTSVTARASILNAGKLYNKENDLLSWLHHNIWHTEYDAADPRSAAISMHRRVHAGNCVYGSPQQWFNLVPTWHSDRLLHDDFALQNRILKESINYDRTSLEEVAFVVDDDSFAWKSPGSKFWRYTHKYLLRAIGQTGAPVDVWLLSDIDRLPDRIKFIVIADASAASPENIAKLKQEINKGKKTFLVVGLPGYINPRTGRRSEDNVSSLLGFSIKVNTTGGSAGIKCAATGKQLAALDSRSVAPKATIDNSDFIVYDDGIGAGHQRPLSGGGRLIWSASPPYGDSALLRTWMQEAGVHFYAPLQTIVRASKELVAVTSLYEDDTDIGLSWPQNVRIEDMYDGWTGQGTDIICPFRYGQSRLFKVKKSPLIDQ